MAVTLPAKFEERLARTTDAELKTRRMTLADMRATYEARVVRDEQTSPNSVNWHPISAWKNSIKWANELANSSPSQNCAANQRD